MDAQPITKVTEITGRYLEDGGNYIFSITSDPVTDVTLDSAVVSMEDIMPPEALKKTRPPFGRKGRFRIAVEFWPEAEQRKETP